MVTKYFLQVRNFHYFDFDFFLRERSKYIAECSAICRGGSRTAATSKMERFVIIVNGLQPLTIITKRSILDVTAALDPPLICSVYILLFCKKTKILMVTANMEISLTYRNFDFITIQHKLCCKFDLFTELLLGKI